MGRGKKQDLTRRSVTARSEMRALSKYPLESSVSLSMTNPADFKIARIVG